MSVWIMIGFSDFNEKIDGFFYTSAGHLALAHPYFRTAG